VHSIRSVLFVGRAERLHAEGVAESPWLDFAWARDAEEAVQLPLSAFDALIVDAPDERVARESVTRLRGAGRGACPPILVRLPATSTTSEVVLRSAGAAAVCRGDATPLCDAIGALAGETAQRPDAAEPPRTGLIARSAAMRDVLALADRAMGSSATVLLSGETGTGKEVLARAIHDGSARRRAAFVAVNCAAFPETLLESELFGHMRGSFTGADKNQQGLFESAQNGTLFLDEIGETSASLQAKLLRALQEREVRPIGGTKPRKVDVRVVAASNRALPREVASGRFREDLYYRLAVFRIALPPLRERADDVLPLAAYFLRRHGAREGKPGCQLSREAADLLLAHSWPGNVRELENEMQRALAIAEPGETIAVRHLSDRLQETLHPLEAAARPDAPESLRAQLARAEAWMLRRALEAHAGRRAATARTLGITREGLYKKMRRFGIE
jgi:transcriptional regulator with PAS, ATPase and Fis domain